MHSIRRTATRASLTRGVFTATSAAPKTQSIAFALRSINAARCFSVAVPRSFSRSVAFHEEQQEQQEQAESPERRQQQPRENGVFIQNYPFDISRQDLIEAFSKFGEVVHIHTPLRKSFCFMYYRTAEEANAAVENVDGTFWHGRRMVVKHSVPKERGDSATGTGFSSHRSFKDRYDGPPTSTLFIGNLSFDATDADLNQLFSILKDVKDVRVAVDKTTGWPRGFAHADFDTVEQATQGMEAINGVDLRGRKVVAKYAPGRRVDSEASRESKESKETKKQEIDWNA